jgi:putative Mg2+ transporter-C (MgtC) family protein
MTELTILSEIFWKKLGLALLCGTIVGFERQFRGKPAGIRTSILICLGTQIFVSLGTCLPEGVAAGAGATRIIGQIITGIGFLGAGVIMAEGGLVKGVTSAAVIWVLAGIGVAIGLGYTGIAFVLTIVTVVVLAGVELLETSFKRLRRGAHASYHRERERPKKDDYNGG